jgi:hypothetical protein
LEVAAKRWGPGGAGVSAPSIQNVGQQDLPAVPKFKDDEPLVAYASLTHNSPQSQTADHEVQQQNPTATLSLDEKADQILLRAGSAMKGDEAQETAELLEKVRRCTSSLCLPID